MDGAIIACEAGDYVRTFFFCSTQHRHDLLFCWGQALRDIKALWLRLHAPEDIQNFIPLFTADESSNNISAVCSLGRFRSKTVSNGQVIWVKLDG